jgi:urease accessory protein
MRRTICLAALALLSASPALAHPGHEASGFLHPLTGLDHLLAMVGVGLWAALMAGRKPVMAMALPAAFLAMMAIGAAAGFAGINLPLVEATILASVFVVGGLIIGAVRLPVPSAMAIVGLFAVFHGYAHALEAPAVGAGSYILGFLMATALLQGVGLAIGWGVRRAAGDLGVRALGGVVLAVGAMVLIAN